MDYYNSKCYPVTGLTQSISPSNSEDDSALTLSNQQHLSTSLAHFCEKPMDSYLKKVNRNLKGPFKKFPVVHLSIKLTTTINSAQVTQSLECKISAQPITAGKPTGRTMQKGLGFLNKVYFQSYALLNNVEEYTNERSEVLIAEDEVNHLKKLKLRLSELAGYLDRILMFYCNFDTISNLPSLKAVKSCARKLHKVISNIKPQRLCHLIPHVPVTAEDVLCTVLGLQENVAHRLANLDPQVRKHQSDKYFLLHFLADHEENCGFDGSLTNTEAVASKLQEIGFTANRSVVIAEWIAKQPLADHQSLLAWAQHYIESLFTYDIFLNDHVSKYPYQETRLDSWFSITVEREREDDEVLGKKAGEEGKSKEDDDDDGVENINVKVINTTPKRVSQFLKEIKKKQAQSYLYYHGTDHESARSILESGINLGAGHPRQDFSDGFGFYLTGTSDYAVKWAQKSKVGAVLIFDIGEDYLHSYGCLDLSPEERNEDWQMVKNHYRNNMKLPRHLKQECEKCDYIKGPISQGGIQEVAQQNIQQICIKKEDMADCIGNATNICGAIFINSH